MKKNWEEGLAEMVHEIGLHHVVAKLIDICAAEPGNEWRERQDALTIALDDIEATL